MNENLLNLSVNIIPIFISLLSPFDNVFIRLFIHDTHVLKDHLIDFKYLISGQSIMICPLSSLVIITKCILPLIGWYFYVLFLSLYLVLYIFILSKFLKVGVTYFL